MVALISNRHAEANSIQEQLAPLQVILLEDVPAGIDLLEQVNTPLLLIVDLALGDEAKDLITMLKNNTFYSHVQIVVLGDSEGECEAYSLSLTLPLKKESIASLIGTYLAFQQKHLGDKGDDISYTALLGQVPVGVGITRIIEKNNQSHHVIHQMNPVFEQILGRSKREIMNLGIEGLTNKEDWAKEKLLLQRVEAGELSHFTLDKRILRGDGNEVWVQVTVFPIRLGDDNQFHYVAFLRDIQAEKTHPSALEESQTLLANLQGVAFQSYLDEALTVFYITDECLELTGYTAEELLSNDSPSYGDIIDPRSYRAVIDRFHEQIKLGNQTRLEYEIITKSGERKWVFELGRVTKGDDPILEGIIIDFTRYKELEKSRLFENDRIPLTGLLNRNALKRQMIDDQADPAKKTSALVSVNFTPLYEMVTRFDHAYVENLLKQIGSTLEQFKDETIQVYGPFDYRFALYLNPYHIRSEVERLATQIIGQVNNLLFSEHVGWGIGIIEIDWSEEQSVDELLRQVVQASDRAFKTHPGRPSIRFYDRAMSDLVHRETTILQELSSIAGGLDEDRLFLNFQPVVSVTENTIVGFEALARLQTNAFGLVGPSEFIQIAEKYRLIIPLGYQILSKALRFQKRLEEKGRSDLWISINLSPFQLLEPGFVSVLSSLMEEKGTNPSNIVFELTESGIYSTLGTINSILKTLQDLGVRIALDDFGVGYSSLARESELQVDFVKIDKLFADQVLTQGTDRSVLGDVISMVHKMRHTTIVEGIEEEVQLQYLKANNCILYQGYLYSKPISEEKTLELWT